MLEISNDKSDFQASIEALKIRILSLEQTESYLTEKLALTESHLSSILNSPVWKITKPLRILNLIWWKLAPSKKAPANLPKIESPRSLFEAIAQECKLVNKVSKPNLRKIVYFAHWHPKGNVTESNLDLLGDLINENWFVSFISSNLNSTSAANLVNKFGNSIQVISKPNRGYDFGSWSVGVNFLSPDQSTQQILFINDSFVVTAKEWKNILLSVQNTSTEVTFLTDCNLHGYHGQSYFIHIKGAAATKQLFIDFWLQIPEISLKEDVIEQLEITFTKLLFAMGFQVSALFPWNIFGTPDSNPSVQKWQQLLEGNFPFIKREVLRSLKQNELSELNIWLEEKNQLNVRRVLIDDVY